LYLYKIIKRKIYKKPLLITYPTGPQVFIKPENISFVDKILNN
jgi:hypothetical protein